MEFYIIPNPKKIEIKGGETYKPTAPNFEDLFRDVVLEKDKNLGIEEYKISIDCKEVKIVSSTDEGLFRAKTTLYQIFTQANGEIPAVEISDFPDFEKRGYMLDISRGKIPELKQLKVLCDILALLKYNQLHLYIDNFVYEFDSFSKYCNEVLTKKEITELEKYCKERHIELIADLNSLGHMENWTRQPEFSHLAIESEDKSASPTLNPLDNGSIELVDKIYSDIIKTFSSEYLHIGMDEPNELGLSQTKEICEKKGVGEVYTDYLLKALELVKTKYKKTPMFWADIIFKHEEQLERLPKDCVLMEWGYEANHPYDRHCSKIQKAGLRYYVCPGTSMWGSYTGRSYTMVENISLAARSGVCYGAEGFLLTEWGDGGNPQFPAMTYFPLVFGGASCWTSGNQNNEICKDEQDELLKQCLKFTDKYIFKTKNNVSVAKICYQLGMYYCLEDKNVFNLTYLGELMLRKKKAKMEEYQSFERVKKYVGELLEQLENAVCDKTYLREIKFDARLVMALADYVCDKAIESSEKEWLKNEFIDLWLLKNKKSGSDFLIEVIDKIEEKK